jgi:hypothetical protein
MEGLPTVPEGGPASGLERLRLSPISVSGTALVRALERLQDDRDLEIRLPGTVRVAPTRLVSLARFAGAAKVISIIRLAPARRSATLVAFVNCMEATAQDEALEVLEMLLNDLFGHATQRPTPSTYGLRRTQAGEPVVEAFKWRSPRTADQAGQRRAS